MSRYIILPSATRCDREYPGDWICLIDLETGKQMFAPAVWLRRAGFENTEEGLASTWGLLEDCGHRGHEVRSNFQRGNRFPRADIGKAPSAYEFGRGRRIYQVRASHLSDHPALESRAATAEYCLTIDNMFDGTRIIVSVPLLGEFFPWADTDEWAIRRLKALTKAQQLLTGAANE
jgi:hypothetical protein